MPGEPVPSYSEVIASIPSWDQMFRIAPVVFIVVALVALGYYAGRRSLREFIDWLKERQK